MFRDPNGPLKRAFDLGLAGASLVLLAPLLLGIALAVLVLDGWPVLFVQMRVGRQGRLFPFYKFRTMVVGAERMGAGYEIDRGDPRITRTGHFLRRWSLDELPQLFNVLKGDMSLVGPRPTLKYQVDQYTPRQRRRLEVRPGLTGLAQVKGRNRLSWPERIELDIWYIDHYSFWLDLAILARTFAAVVDAAGIYGRGWAKNEGDPGYAPGPSSRKGTP
jgi:lipopolysaccharide/colanic/teichoic acid biosynthesis glycosyltransferase